MKVEIGPYHNNFPWERIINVHIDDYDIWSLDHTLALVILPALQKFLHDADGIPASFIPANFDHNSDEEHDKYMREWKDTIREMIWSFEQIVSDDDGYGLGVEEYKKHQAKIAKGLELFGKHFQSLWT